MLYTIRDLFDLERTIARELLSGLRYPFEALPRIRAFIALLGETLPAEEYDCPRPLVWIARDAAVADSAFIGDYVIIDHEADVRHCAFIRGNAIIGKNAVVGNSTELKNAILFDGVQAPHYNYVGDSILGHKAHMGAGSVTSNVKGDKSPVTIRQGNQTIETGLKKVGAMLGDFAEIGCNAVLNPGCVIGRGAQVYPLSSVRGAVPAGHIYKRADMIVERR